MLLSHVALKTIMLLVLKILPALILLAVLLMVGGFVYAKVEKKNYQTLSDTKDLGERISQLAFAGDNSLDKMGIEILKLASKISL